jgi:hypothetical protein
MRWIPKVIKILNWCKERCEVVVVRRWIKMEMARSSKLFTKKKQIQIHFFLDFKLHSAAKIGIRENMQIINSSCKNV